jgi:hypothetical protein
MMGGNSRVTGLGLDLKNEYGNVNGAKRTSTKKIRTKDFKFECVGVELWAVGMGG